MKIEMLASFSVNNTEDVIESKKTFEMFLTDGEEVLLAYKHKRDKVVFTSSKIICYDVQGFTGSKKEFKFFPYSKITSYSVESAGFLDGDSDFKIWVSGVGCFEIKFGLKLNAKEPAKLLAKKVL